MDKDKNLEQERINHAIENLKAISIANHSEESFSKIIEEGVSSYFEIERKAEKKGAPQILKKFWCTLQKYKKGKK